MSLPLPPLLTVSEGNGLLSDFTISDAWPSGLLVLRLIPRVDWNVPPTEWRSWTGTGHLTRPARPSLHLPQGRGHLCVGAWLPFSAERPQ